MALSFNSLLRRLACRWPVLLYAAGWTALLTLTVAVASFSPELAFISAISPSSSFTAACETEASFRIPLDVPTEILCFPSHLFRRSVMDLLVPPVFAAVVIAGSVFVVRALAL
ncbi:uncharacterized protein LOC131159820 [Malania oleifera]|uniref:uncharacterized protein LOC131159820 n=1 Tax=Malania oleifera TaxID=397392 RepID=UPI0025AE47F2|nr:uncharacterized protein LOC131159820 [Malania oleifera]